MKAVIMLSDEDRKNLNALFDREYGNLVEYEKKAKGNDDRESEWGIRASITRQRIRIIYEVLDAIGVDNVNWFDESETGICRQE